MTGYVMMSKEDFEKALGTPEQADIEVYIMNGGQQTRGIQKAMNNTLSVREHRQKPKHFPVVTIYSGSEMDNVAFSTVMSLYLYLLFHAIILLP
jgi:hypothetical protein